MKSGARATFRIRCTETVTAIKVILATVITNIKYIFNTSTLDAFVVSSRESAAPENSHFIILFPKAWSRLGVSSAAESVPLKCKNKNMWFYLNNSVRCHL